MYCSEGNTHGTRVVIPSAPHCMLATRLSTDYGRAVGADDRAEGLGNGNQPSRAILRAARACVRGVKSYTIPSGHSIQQY